MVVDWAVLDSACRAVWEVAVVDKPSTVLNSLVPSRKRLIVARYFTDLSTMVPDCCCGVDTADAECVDRE